jgi:uncharacterized protein
MSRLIEPGREEILRYCNADPIERVFLEDVARRGHGTFAGVARRGSLVGLCHLGTNVVPSGDECASFAALTARSGARMVIGESGAVTELWSAARKRMPHPRADRPGQPVYAIFDPPPAGETALRPATLADLDLLVPACAASHYEELGVDPLSRDPTGFRWRTRVQVEEGRSWLWEEAGTILFKAEASAWTPSAVQLQQVWTDPPVRRRGHASRALRDLIRLLLGRSQAVCLFVRAENEAAIALYESVGMRHVLDYRSILF